MKDELAIRLVMAIETQNEQCAQILAQNQQQHTDFMEWAKKQDEWLQRCDAEVVRHADTMTRVQSLAPRDRFERNMLIYEYERALSQFKSDCRFNKEGIDIPAEKEKLYQLWLAVQRAGGEIE